MIAKHNFGYLQYLIVLQRVLLRSPAGLIPSWFCRVNELRSVRTYVVVHGLKLLFSDICVETDRGIVIETEEAELMLNTSR